MGASIRQAIQIGPPRSNCASVPLHSPHCKPTKMRDTTEGTNAGHENVPDDDVIDGRDGWIVGQAEAFRGTDKLNRYEGAVDFPTAANEEPFVSSLPVLAPIPAYPPRPSMHHIQMHLQPSSCMKQEKNANEIPSHPEDVANASLPPPRSRSPPPCPPPPPPSPTNDVGEVPFRQQLPPPRMEFLGVAAAAATPKRVAWCGKAAIKLQAFCSRLRAPCSRILTGLIYGRDYRGLEIKVYVAYEQLQCDM